MKRLGRIDAEGGPLLLIDAEDQAKWNGVDGSDYDRACDLFDRRPELEGMPIDLDGTEGILWEIAGPGTVEVCLGASDLPVLIRAWLNDEGLRNSEVALETFVAVPPESKQAIGNLVIRSGIILMLWATENASGLHLRPGPNKIDILGELAIENSVLAVKIPNDSYKLKHVNIENEYGQCRKLLIEK